MSGQQTKLCLLESYPTSHGDMKPQLRPQAPPNNASALEALFVS